MIRTERERIRETRKSEIIKAFVGNEVLYTNQVATKIKVVWPQADILLQSLVQEGRLTGNKMIGYSVPKKETFRDKIRKFLHI
jgi:hypothetical protein